MTQTIEKPIEQKLAHAIRLGKFTTGRIQELLEGLEDGSASKMQVIQGLQDMRRILSNMPSKK